MHLPHRNRPCANCPYRKDCRKGWLGARRAREISSSGSFLCHKNTSLQCAGSMLLNGSDNDFVRLAGRMNIKLKLSGRELVFSSREDMIKHHDDGL